MLPMEGNNGRGMYSGRRCCRVDVELEWWAALEKRQRLVFTHIEGRGSITVKQILLELWEILLCGRAWQRGWSRGWRLPTRTGAAPVLSRHDHSAVAASGSLGLLLGWGA